MNNDTQLKMTPEAHTEATARYVEQATARATEIWGDAGREITEMFRPSDVARIVTEELAPALMIAREIAETERDIAELNLATALARIKQLEG
jgi:hypothetical protein